MSHAGGNHPSTEPSGGEVGATNHVSLLRRLEATLPTIEEAGCAVGSGVVTGADGIFIGRYADLPVEAERKLPLIKAQDLAGGALDDWRGLGLVNPFEPDGAQVNRADAPRLATYLERHETALRARPYAQQNPQAWWRPIDRIHAHLATTPKLLIPDSKAGATIVYDAGRFYPHRTVSYITARDWDLQALAAVLSTPITRLFIAAYSSQMRGGTLRVQVTALRHLRLPAWADVPADLAAAVVEAAQDGNLAATRRAAYELYRLTRDEQAVVTALPLEHG